MASDVSDQRRVNRTPLPSRLRRGPVASDHRVCTSGGLTRYFRTANKEQCWPDSVLLVHLCAVLGVRATLS